MAKRATVQPFTPEPPFNFHAEYPAMVRREIDSKFAAMCANPSSEWAFYWRAAREGEKCAPPVLALASPGDEYAPMQGVGYLCGMAKESAVRAVTAYASKLPILG